MSRARPLEGAAGLFAALVALRLAVALAPADPMILGVPFGILLEFGIIALSTGVLAVASRAVFTEDGGRARD